MENTVDSCSDKSEYLMYKQIKANLHFVFVIVKALPINSSTGLYNFK